MTSSATLAVFAQAEQASVGALPTKQARSERTRDRLLEAGQELLQKGGFDDMSIAQIAQRAGCSVGAFYFRFRDKEAYFQFLLERVIGTIKTRVLAELMPERLARLSGAEVVRHCVANYIDLNRDHEGLIRAVQKHTLHHRESWQPVKELAYWIISRYADAAAAAYGQQRNAQFKLQITIGFQIASGHLMNAIMNKPDQLGLHSDALLFWLNEVVLHCIQVELPSGSELRPLPLQPTSLTPKEIST